MARISSAPHRAAAQQERGASTHSLWRTGVIALPAAGAANLLVRAIGVRVFSVSPDFKPLQVGPVIFFTLVGIVGAVTVFAVVARLTRRPVGVYRALALAVLALSFLPDLSLLSIPPSAEGQMAGMAATGPEVAILLLMHVVTAGVCVGLLTPPAWPHAGGIKPVH